MSRRIIQYAFEEAARKAAEVRTQDEYRRQAFLDGAKWLAQKLLDQIRPGIMDNMIDKDTRRYLDDLSFSSVKEILWTALESRYAEEK